MRQPPAQSWCVPFLICCLPRQYWRPSNTIVLMCRFHIDWMTSRHFTAIGRSHHDDPSSIQVVQLNQSGARGRCHQTYGSATLEASKKQFSFFFSFFSYVPSGITFGLLVSVSAPNQAPFHCCIALNAMNYDSWWYFQHHIFPTFNGNVYRQCSFLQAPRPSTVSSSLSNCWASTL